jgi:hypothetical protein
MVGRLAEAAKASATRKAMFSPACSARMPRPIATAPMTTAVIRATRTSPLGGTFPFLITDAYTSCANEADAVIVRPATTARIVANATPAMMPRNTVPPSSKASSGAAALTAPGAPRIRSGPTRAPAP